MMVLISYVFKCVECNHVTEIYFQEKFFVDEVFVEDICQSCGEQKLLNNGDMGYRTDYAEPMYPPWQLQCVNLNPSRRFCTDCSMKEDFKMRDVLPDCHRCGNTMVYQSEGTGDDTASLRILLNKLYKK